MPKTHTSNGTNRHRYDFNPVLEVILDPQVTKRETTAIILHSLRTFLDGADLDLALAALRNVPKKSI
jgi:hypothetical protein